MKGILSKFIWFRFKQVGRLLGDIGWVRTGVLVLLLSALFFNSLSNQLFNKPLLLILLYPSIILPFHLQRNDDVFLMQFPINKRWVYIAEYNLIMLPFTIVVAFFSHLYIVSAGHALASLVALIPSYQKPKIHPGKKRLIKRIPYLLFEWRGFFRKYYLFFVFSYFAALLLSKHLFIVPLFILFWIVCFSEAFNHLESKEMIEEYPAEKSFLTSKLINHSVFIHLLFSPLYLLFLFFHYQVWYILILCIILAELSVVFFLYYKYSRVDLFESTVKNQLPYILFLAATILFFPIGVLLLYLYRNRAQSALHPHA